MTQHTYRIKCWGHETAPDLDYLADEIDRQIINQYPCTSIQRLKPITQEQIREFMRGQQE